MDFFKLSKKLSEPIDSENKQNKDKTNRQEKPTVAPQRSQNNPSPQQTLSSTPDRPFSPLSSIQEKIRRPWIQSQQEEKNESQNRLSLQIRRFLHRQEDSPVSEKRRDEDSDEPPGIHNRIKEAEAEKKQEKQAESKTKVQTTQAEKQESESPLQEKHVVESGQQRAKRNKGSSRTQRNTTSSQEEKQKTREQQKTPSLLASSLPSPKTKAKTIPFPLFPLSLRFLVSPTAKGRPRFNAVTQRVYTPKKTLWFEDTVQLQAKAFLASLPRKLEEQGLLPFGEDKAFALPLFACTIPLSVTVELYFPRTETLKARKLPQGLMWKVTKPDLDNLIKSLFDALNEVVWEDDRQIVETTIRKMYVAKPSASTGEETEASISLFVQAATPTPLPRKV